MIEVGNSPVFEEGIAVAKDQRKRKASVKDQASVEEPRPVDDPTIVTPAAAERHNVGKEATTEAEAPPTPTLALGAGGGPPVPIPLAASPTVREQLFLTGLMPVEEFLQVTADQPAPSMPWEVQWHQAAAARQVLSMTEAGVADDPATHPLPPELEELLAPVRADAIFQQTVANTPHDFRMVEVDKLVVYQKFINVDHADRLNQDMLADLDPQRLIDFCFPLCQQKASPTIYPAGNSLYLISESSDLRPLPPGPQLLPLDPAQVGCLLNHPLPRTVGAGVALVMLFGYSLNFFHALAVEGRLVLNNAYHRTYTLRRRGQTRVPCLVQTVSREQFPAVVPGSPLAQNPDLYLKAPRPPLFKDFFDPQLHVKLANRPTRSMFRLTARFEVEGRVLIH